LIKILRYLAQHPLTRDDFPRAVLRFVSYQAATRLREETVIPWIEGTKLVVRRHMPGASGNIYCGLHEYTDMGFLIHFLRPGDLFLDIGANVGSWTVLASGLCGARTVAVEPDPGTAQHLLRNVEVNAIRDLVDVRVIAVGPEDGSILFTVGRDTENRIAKVDDPLVQEVRAKRLDGLLDEVPTLIKMDVEGFEEGVVAGGSRTLSSKRLQAVFTELVTPMIQRTFTDAGLHRAWYDPASRSLTPKPNGLQANNALFVRDMAIAAERVRVAPPRQVLGKAL
jgi:FkbM family methyltransferase